LVNRSPTVETVGYTSVVPPGLGALVTQESEGEVHLMEARDWLMRASDNGRKPMEQIVFKGEQFDVMGVRRRRERVLRQG